MNLFIFDLSFLIVLLCWSLWIIHTLRKVIKVQISVISTQKLTIAIFQNLMAINANDMLEASQTND